MQEAKIINNWIICPICGKKQFPVENNTVIRNLLFQCKTSKKENKHYFIVNTGGM